MVQVSINFLNGDSAVLDGCKVVNDIRVRISHMRHPFLPPEVILATFPGGVVLTENYVPPPSAVSAVLCAEDHTPDFWMEAFLCYVRFGDDRGVSRCVHELVAQDPDFVSRTLCDAVDNGDTCVVKALVEHAGPHLEEAANAQNQYGWTPLHMAACHGTVEIVDMLCGGKSEVAVNVKNNIGRTPLHLAASPCDRTHQHDPKVVELLLSRTDVAVNVQDEDGESPLHCAARYGKKAVVELLLARNDVEVNAQDVRGGRTPLHFAVLGGFSDVVELLLSRSDVQVNAKDTMSGRTPLHFAAIKRRKEVVEVLLSRQDVAIHEEDEGGSTPLHLASRTGEKDVMELLRASMEDRECVM